MARAPAGWYADVQHPQTERWFDGGAWTDRRRPATGELPAVDDGHATPDGRARRPARPPTGWLPTALGGAALATALAAVGLLSILTAF